MAKVDRPLPKYPLTETMNAKPWEYLIVGMEAFLGHVCDDVEACERSEFMRCGKAYCPTGEALHFHHDGCPSCLGDDEEGYMSSGILIRQPRLGPGAP